MTVLVEKIEKAADFLIALPGRALKPLRKRLPSCEQAGAVLRRIAAPLRLALVSALKMAHLLGRALRPLWKVLAPVLAPVLGPVGRVLAPHVARGAALLNRVAPPAWRWIKGARQRALDARVPLMVRGAGLFLGLFITLMGVGSLSTVIILVVGASVLAAATCILYAGVQGRAWAISLSFVLIAFTIDATARRRGDMADSGMDAQTVFKLMLWGGALLIGTLNFSQIKRALQESAPLRWLSVFGAWSLMSTVYSITPTYTFGGGFGYLALLCFSAVVVQTVGMDKLRLAAIYACGLLTTSALILYMVMPSIAVAQLENGSTPRLAGLTGSPNNLGRTAAIALFFIFFAVRDKHVKLKRPDIAIIAFCSTLALYLSWSRTSLAAVIVAVGIVLIRKRFIVMLWGAIAALGTLFIMVVMNVDWERLFSAISRGGSLSEITTLTGRTAIWDFVWGAFLKAPLLGYGYGSTKLLIPTGFRTIYAWTTTSAHNMFLQALVTTGIVGGVCIVMVVLLQLRDFFKRPNDMADAAFIFVLITGFSEAGAVGVAPNLLTIFWIISLVVPRGERSAAGVRDAAAQQKSPGWGRPLQPHGAR